MSSILRTLQDREYHPTIKIFSRLIQSKFLLEKFDLCRKLQGKFHLKSGKQVVVVYVCVFVWNAVVLSMLSNSK
jgi:hypothetical protein